MNGKEEAMDISNQNKIWPVVLLWSAIVGYMALIFFLSSRHLDIPPLLPDYFDKLVHVLIYVPLGFLFFISLKKSGFNKYVFLISFLMAGIYGITDEFHQSFVPGREASLFDVVADFVGAFLGSFLADRIRF